MRAARGRRVRVVVVVVWRCTRGASAVIGSQAGKGHMTCSDLRSQAI